MDDQGAALPDSREETDEKPSRGRIPLPVALVFMVLALLGAGLIISVIAEPLYELVFPTKEPDTDPPIPAGVEQIEHNKPDDSAEYWLFRTAMPGEDVVAFYEDAGGACWLAPAPDPPPDDGISYSFAQCEGQSSDDDIRTKWEVYISVGYSASEGPTIFRVYKVWR